MQLSLCGNNCHKRSLTKVSANKNNNFYQICRAQHAKLPRHRSLENVVQWTCSRGLTINQRSLGFEHEVFQHFYARQRTCYSAYTYMLWQFRPSICPSVTRVDCIETAGNIIEILSLSDRPIILIFRNQGSLRKSDGFIPNRGAEYKGGSNFRPICGYISETVIDRYIFTTEDEYKVVCALSNSAAFDDLQWTRTPVSRSQYRLKANMENSNGDISATDHPTHSMFGSRLGVSGSADRLALFPVGPNSNNGGVGKTWYFLALCITMSKTLRDTTKVTISD